MRCAEVIAVQDPVENPGLHLPPGVPALTALYVYVTGACNLACKHCWVSPEYGSEDDGSMHVPVELVQRAVEQAKPLGLRSVKLTGGEPTLHPDFKEIVSFLNRESLKLLIETNGILIDTALARFLKKQTHLSFISVSLDGAAAEIHDRLRGVRGSFEAAVAGIRALVSEGFHPQMICSLHRGNVRNITSQIKLAEDLGCGSVKFNVIHEIGRGRGFGNGRSLTVSQVLRAYEQVENIPARSGRPPVFFDIPFAFRSLKRLLNDSLCRCSVKNILGLLGNGQYALCGIGVSVPELAYGNAGDENLRNIWYSSPGLHELRDCIPFHLEGICGECLHRNMCSGYCVASNFHSAGRLNAPYEFCNRAEAEGLFPASRKRPSY